MFTGNNVHFLISLMLEYLCKRRPVKKNKKQSKKTTKTESAKTCCQKLLLIWFHFNWHELVIALCRVQYGIFFAFFIIYDLSNEPLGDLNKMQNV